MTARILDAEDDHRQAELSRRKVEDDPGEPTVLRTVYGVGDTLTAS